jgi:hypothetical protein
MLALKVIFDPETGKILGGQATGTDGADKRIDVLATAIYAGLTVDDLMNLELAYAPQFGSAKDAVNQLGYAANNVWHQRTPSVQWHELDERVAAGAALRPRSPLDRSERSDPDSPDSFLRTLRVPATKKSAVLSRRKRRLRQRFRFESKNATRHILRRADSVRGRSGPSSHRCLSAMASSSDVSLSFGPDSETAKRIDALADVSAKDIRLQRLQR